jgi:virulence factor Mce-like protein
MSSANQTTSPLRRALFGVAFLMIIVLLLGFTVAKFQQRLPWQRTIPVTLRVSRAGTQLNNNADVKLRGIVVGRVSEQRSTGEGAELTLALDPADAKLVPTDVRARILPKTLFGEKFVDLVIPASSTGRPIARGTVIGEDRSEAAVEVERVLSDLFPLLRSLQPEKLNRALTAISDGLRDRGEQLGRSLEKLDGYLAGIEPELPAIQRDLSGLADLADSLGDNAGDLVRIARASTVSARTVTSREDILVSFLRGISGFTDVTTEILERDGDRIIHLSESSRPILQTVYDRRGIIPGTVKGLEQLVIDLNQALGQGKPEQPALSIRLEVVPNRGAYTVADRPKYGGSSAQVAASDTGTVGSPAEKAVLQTLLGAVLDVAPDDVPDVTVLLFGPVLRGEEVGVL